MSRASLAKILKSEILHYMGQAGSKINRNQQPCDVFINHRGADTKRTIAGLLYDDLERLNIRGFLDSQSLKPGDKLFEKISSEIRGCKVGIAVFSPNYCDSYFCLHELALLMECKKNVVPIFFDIKPSELQVVDKGSCPSNELRRFKWALDQAKYTVGITFDSQTGSWPDLVRTATENVVKKLIEAEEEKERDLQNRSNVDTPLFFEETGEETSEGSEVARWEPFILLGMCVRKVNACIPSGMNGSHPRHLTSLARFLAHFLDI